MRAKMFLKGDEDYRDVLERTSSTLGNYYGVVSCIKRTDGYFMALEDHSDEMAIEVSKEFYDAFIKEFGKPC